MASRRAFLRTIVGLDDEQTARLTTSDWLLCQINGQTGLRKISPELAIPDGGVDTDQLAAGAVTSAKIDSGVPLLNQTGFVSFGTLGANVDTADTILVNDSSAGALKRVTPGQLIPDGTIANAEINGSAEIDRSKLATYFSTQQSTTDKSVTTSYTTISSTWYHSFSFSIPRAGDYLIIAVLGGTIGVNAAAVAILYGQMKDLNGSIAVTDRQICAADGAYDPTVPASATANGAGTATLVSKCTVASPGTKTVVTQCKYAIVANPLGTGVNTSNTKHTDSFVLVASI